LATVDDLGVIAVIAVVFAHHICPMYLAASAAILAGTALLGRARRESSKGFILPACAMWYCLLKSGVSADIAGVLVAFCIPMRSKSGKEVLGRLAHSWSMWSSLIILPIFALANCAVPLSFSSLGGGASLATPVAVSTGIFFGLLIGKPLGIFGSSYLAIKAGIAPMPAGMTKRHLAMMGILGGIGFTMCLFLIQESMHGPLAQMSKISVFISSAASAIVGAYLMARQPLRNQEQKQVVEVIS